MLPYKERIKIIGDDIYVGSVKIGTITAPLCGERERFIEAVDEKPTGVYT